ncbi:hypothetical protein [Pseudonocardia acaciae]|uniref:hypothetical protein n=1 Tax=Pseudonocardia acaciae TaxID=551276 RepID=UPI0012ECE4EA|nr:hypothetical protein [Pseudonocardia acaciae]
MIRKSHKGPRLLLNVYLPGLVVQRIDQDARRCGASSRSQLLADRLSAFYGRSDLVRELDREQLELGTPTDGTPAPEEHEELEVTFRVPSAVGNLIDQDAQRNGNLTRRSHMARVLVSMYYPEGAPERPREEQLELSVRSRREPAA